MNTYAENDVMHVVMDTQMDAPDDMTKWAQHNIYGMFK